MDQQKLFLDPTKF